MHTKTLILGGGLTGLSVAYHLEQLGHTDYLLAERAPVPGGLCASQTVQNFTFDYSGHLLHLHTPYGKKLVKKLLKTNLARLKRNTWVYTGASRVPFPFQANLFALPPAIRQVCVDGLLKAAARQKKTPPKNFKNWCLQSFGTGVYEQFMRPYNTKLWGRDPKDLTCDWCGPFVPTPSPKEIVKSAQNPPKKSYGYNSYFYYPKTGGCGALVEALAKHVSQLQLNAPVTHINLKKKTALVGGKKVSFDRLVSTLPLPDFLHLLEGETRLAKLADNLINTTVTVYNFAINRRIKPFSWIYCPDETDPFYRVGLQSAFSPANAPERTSSFYVEIQGKYPHTQAAEKRIWKALIQKGIIEEYDEVLFSFWQTIPCAYVVFDKRRARVLNQIWQALQRRDCFCAGRYGRWEYSFMESSLLQGLELAEKLV